MQIYPDLHGWVSVCKNLPVDEAGSIKSARYSKLQFIYLGINYDKTQSTQMGKKIVYKLSQKTLLSLGVNADYLT